MRPLRLTMQAFGPYAGREEIDFRRLGGKSFFLIHGPTGSGKTTILDAMCFALYGDTSGDLRHGKDMRSHHSDPETVTEIVFDFSLGASSYRVSRMPEQQRPMKRGDGMTTQRPQATLWKLGRAEEPEAPAEEVVETQWSRVTERIEAILGFRSDQFRQVIMLPQGQFQELLTETSKQREDILEMLFKTEIYSRIEAALKAAAKDLTDRMEELDRRRTFILDRAQAGDPEELRRRLRELEVALGKAEEQLERLHAKEARIQARVQAARELNALFQEREEAEGELSDFLEAEPEMKNKRERLKVARKAAGLIAVEETVSERRAETEEAEKALEEARSSLEEAARAKSEAAQALAREKRREAGRKAASKNVLHLETLAGQIDQLESARTSMERFHESMQSADHLVKQRRREHKEIRLRIKALEKDLAQAREEAARGPALRLLLERSRSNLAQRQGLDDSRSRLEDLKRSLKSAEQEAKQAQASYDQARSLLARMEERWTSGQAGILARALKPGEPCPVCGSPEHPNPAVLSPKVPEENALRSQRATVEEWEQERDRKRQVLTTRQQEVTRLEAEAQSMEKSLGEAAELSLKSVQAEIAGLKRDLGVAAAAEETVKAGTADLEDSSKHEAELVEVLEAEEKALKKAEGAFESASAVVAERERKLPKNLRTRDQLEEALRKAKADLDDLLEALEKARQLETDSRQRYAEAKAAADGARRSLKIATRRMASAREKFSKRLKAAGFARPADYRRAKLEEGEIDSLADMIERHEAGIKAARSRLTRARQATRRKKRPDLTSLENKARKAKASCDKKIAETAEIRKEQGRIVDLDRDLASTERKTRALAKRYYVTGRIAEVANGRNEQGITFQRFVLAALLDEVLRAATERLRVMSRGRYDLHRAEERTDRRLAGGLDLEVFDTFTGYTRPVTTLSGGETFLAALSLALGLADVVQAYAGGIHLETVFIDEGFGSLDPEALELALRALVDLQEGNRLVGIISHVPELKERIDVRLEVTRTRRGSTVGFTGL